MCKRSRTRSSAKSRYACEPPAIAAASDVPAQRKTPSQVAILLSCLPPKPTLIGVRICTYICVKKGQQGVYDPVRIFH